MCCPATFRDWVIYMLMTLIVKVELILKLMYLCTKIVNNFKNIELFSDWVSTQEDNTNNNGNGLGTSLPNITVNGESTTVDDENTDEISIMTESVTLGQMNLQDKNMVAVKRRI